MAKNTEEQPDFFSPKKKEKPSVPPKPPRVRTPLPRVPQGNESEQTGVGAGSTTVAAAQVETTLGIIQPQTSSEVSQPLQRSSKKSGWLFSGQVEVKRSNTLPRTSSHTPQPRPFSVVPTLPAEAQLNTTQTYADGNHSTSESVRSASFSSSERPRRYDKSMIGPPTDFQHVGHVGSNELGNSSLGTVKTLMQSKGGYSNDSDVPDSATPKGTFVKHLRECRPVPSTQHQGRTVVSPEAETVQSSNHPQISSQVQETPHQTRAPIPDVLSPPAKAQPSTTRSLTTQPLGHTTSTSVEYSSSHSENLAQFFMEVTALITKLDHLCKEKTDLLGESAKLEERYQQLLKELQNAQNEVEQLSHQLAEKDALLQTVQTEQLQLKKQTQEKDQSICNLRSQVDSLTQQLSHQLAEKDALLQTAQAEQQQLRQQTQEKDRFIHNLQSQVDSLAQQVKTQRSALKLQSQQSPQSEFWEVPRGEICLNKQSILGTGAWGYVVEGTFRGQPVAVKCLHDMIRTPDYIEMFRKEIGIMAHIRHPNLVLLIAAVIDAEDDPLIVTELLNISLRKAYQDKLLQHPMPGCKLHIFRDIASALNYLHLHHRGEIIHRDVSSGNVLLEAKPNNQWKAKLSDFGSAKLAIEAKTTGPGAPVYAAPEVRQQTGIRQTAKVDVYSYGILLCEVILGQLPREEKLPSMMQVIQSSSEWAFMHGLIVSCIQDHPDKRPAMTYVLSALDKVRL